MAIEPHRAMAAGLRGGRRAVVALGIGAALLLAGCAGAPPAAPPPANVEVPFDAAIANASDALLVQMRALDTFVLPLQLRRLVVVEPMLDALSGQQTVATRQLEQRVGRRLTDGLAGIELQPMARAEVVRAPYLLTGTLTRALAGRPKGSLLLNLALVDLQSGTVVAQAWALTNDTGLDATPLPFDADSPVLLKDKVAEGLVRSSATGAGKPADAAYLAHLAVAPRIAHATVLYNAGSYADALVEWRAAAALAGGDQLRVLTGLYLTDLKLGRPTEAESAFGKLAAHGIANDRLGVKFPFEPGSAVFASDAKVDGPHAMWLRQIAREAMAAKACLHIVGHASPTGPEAANKVLSLQRAQFIRQRLAAESNLLAARSKAIGMGSSENIVGSGTDDTADALDRRVEFRVVRCG